MRKGSKLFSKMENKTHVYAATEWYKIAPMWKIVSRHERNPRERQPREGPPNLIIWSQGYRVYQKRRLVPSKRFSQLKQAGYQSLSFYASFDGEVEKAQAVDVTKGYSVPAKTLLNFGKEKADKIEIPNYILTEYLSCLEGKNKADDPHTLELAKENLSPLMDLLCIQNPGGRPDEVRLDNVLENLETLKCYRNIHCV